MMSSCVAAEGLPGASAPGALVDPPAIGPGPTADDPLDSPLAADPPGIEPSDVEQATKTM
jgi:hypothetical protein